MQPRKERREEGVRKTPELDLKSTFPCPNSPIDPASALTIWSAKFSLQTLKLGINLALTCQRLKRRIVSNHCLSVFLITAMLV